MYRNRSARSSHSQARVAAVPVRRVNTDAVILAVLMFFLFFALLA